MKCFLSECRTSLTAYGCNQYFCFYEDQKELCLCVFWCPGVFLVKDPLCDCCFMQQSPSLFICVYECLHSTIAMGLNYWSSCVCTCKDRVVCFHPFQKVNRLLSLCQSQSLNGDYKQPGFAWFYQGLINPQSCT